MKIIFLGTNGWYDTNTGNTICVLVKDPRYHIIFDAGNGLYKIDTYLSNQSHMGNISMDLKNQIVKVFNDKLRLNSTGGYNPNF